MCLVTTTKDQSGGIYNSYITGGQGFMAVSKQTSSSGYALRLNLFTAINPWHYARYNRWKQMYRNKTVSKIMLMVKNA